MKRRDFLKLGALAPLLGLSKGSEPEAERQTPDARICVTWEAQNQLPESEFALGFQKVLQRHKATVLWQEEDSGTATTTFYLKLKGQQFMRPEGCPIPILQLISTHTQL